MTAKIQPRQTLGMAGKQPRASKITGVRPSNIPQRTEAAWAKVVASYESVPDLYQEFFRSHLSKGQPFPYTVLTPTYEAFGVRISAKLICAIDHTLHVLEGNGSSAVKLCYPIDEINYVEVSSMLLDFRVNINGVTNLGIQACSTFRSSTATDYMFAPLLKRIRLRSDFSSSDAPCRDAEEFDRWSLRSCKFMNLARHCVLAGETVVRAVLQPEIRAGKILRKTIAPTHVCILTDKELILIREELLQRRDDKYGAIWDFIPLSKIESCSVDKKERDLLVLSTQLKNDECFECLFEPSLKSEVEDFLAQTRELLPKERSYCRD